MNLNPQIALRKALAQTLCALSVVSILCGSAALAATPEPLATIPGEVRSFSPDGRYAAVLGRASVALYDTSSWKRLGEAALAPYRSVHALLVDNQRRMAAIYETTTRRLEIWALTDRLNSLGASDVPADRGIVLADQQLIVRGLTQAFVLRRVVFENSRTGVSDAGDEYTIYRYDCPIDHYLRLAASLRNVMEGAPLSELRRACNGSAYGTSLGGTASFRMVQSDHALREGISRWGYTGHPARGRGDFVERDYRYGDEPLAIGVRYTTRGNDPLAAVEKMSTRAYELVAGPTWQVRSLTNAFPAFDLTQLGIPGYVPRRVSPDGSMVTFSLDGVTKIYAADVVLDRYANLDPDVLEDVLMERITSLLREKRSAEALPFFERLNKTGRPLPESFYYYRLETLEASGKKAEARDEASAYLKKFGRTGKYYSNVVAMLARL